MWKLYLYLVFLSVIKLKWRKFVICLICGSYVLWFDKFFIEYDIRYDFVYIIMWNWKKICEYDWFIVKIYCRYCI